MWYEIIPAVALVAVGLTVPPIAGYGLNYLFNNGKWTCRFWENNPQDFQLYLRDRRITGSEYKPRGLEGVPEKQ